MALLDKILLLLFSFYFIQVNSHEYIPVYVWEKSKTFIDLPALGHIHGEFKDILLDKLKKEDVVLVFLEENLSPEDFTTSDSSGENVFHELSHIKSEAQVNYYPFVETPLASLESLPNVKITRINVTSTGLPPDAKIEPGDVVIVDLNDASENEDRSQMLRRHDSLVASIYKSVMAKHENVIALYTARHSSWLVPNELEGNIRKTRQLLEVSENKSNILNAEYFLMYVSSPVVFINDDKENALEILAVKTSNENSTVLISGSISLTLRFDSHLGYWYFKNITIEENNVVTCKLNVSEVYAPFNFSYHCNNTIYSNGNCSLSMPGFQLERFESGKQLKFGDAYDCIGFTTAPIWSGLFVTFILAIITTVGLCMIMDIKTMDRFDDPKGKTISINVVE